MISCICRRSRKVKLIKLSFIRNNRNSDFYLGHVVILKMMIKITAKLGK